ncbi:Formate hydrogenlyase subunit 3/Multisubunit Na+/H+ antiporter, MnhD subunit [Anaerovibrio sp. JC8]|uniref:proton-conducting transporter transmembrane domain-containing protein n=1 Tax=Anaerovibrio sp. JC8 TaxID=1240085 RepID=UPI000A0C786C|nr:proton-conducting transporter membrane subunit [Anaerovibrio sp. JC8]ORU00656.1 Formate hydrogenlyase subunit 3/Multisubunit Na+/H+ antiporter, MnhD subunit [Anaerovibrio sp. JC8]
MNFDIRELIYIILALPLIFSAVAAVNFLGRNVLHWLNRLVATGVGAAIVMLLMTFDSDIPFAGQYIYLDALSMWMLIIIGSLYFAFAWTSKAYLDRDTNKRYGYLRRFGYLEGRFYALSHIFVWIMLLVVLVNNLGLMWVTIEATTLVSALLVAFKFTRTSLEATWKYVMVCTVGICLALLGTIIVYYMQLYTFGSENALNWLYLAEHSKALDPAMAKFALCFLFVGYGTKIGLAPMHAWLPDAYSEAPALTSGLLSGSLCSCAVYVLIRNIIILMPSIGIDFISGLCLFFGLFTILVAVPFVVVQRDIKRMLAYSSMENFGLMMAAFGLFVPVAAQAMLLNLFNHALVKFSLFYMAGTVIGEYGTKNMMRIHGMMVQVPRTATFLLLGIVALLGMPPFGIFFSKFFMLYGFFSSDHPWLGVVTMILLAGMLIGILYHVMRMLGGKPKRRVAGEFFGVLDSVVIAGLLVFGFIVSAGLGEITMLNHLLTNATKIVLGGVA